MPRESANEYLSRLQTALEGRYVIEREIGTGGMAIVYLAREIRHDRAVAIKLLLPEITSLVGAERFIREIRLTATLQHPHILPLYDSGESDGLLYAVMPYVSGKTLRERISSEGHLPLEEAISITCKLARALDYAHHQGVIHRDIKPENVLLHNGEPLLADFGIALPIDAADAARITSRGISVGTPQYMSPEQAAAERSLTPASDVYSLGAVAYEMLVGEPPVTGPSTKAIIARLLTETPRGIRTVRETVPARVEAVILKALAKSPVDRYNTAAHFAAALEKAQDGRETGLVSWMRQYRKPAVGAMAVALFLLAIPVKSWIVNASSDADRLKSLALLPCENISRDTSQAYLADRWTEELINKLSKIGELRPKSWLSVQRYKGTPKTAREIGSELNAGSLVRCRIAEEPTRVRLAMQLIRADDDRVAWSNDYSEPAGIDGVNAAQSAAVLEIARVLSAGVSQPLALAVERPLTRDSGALRLYRLGRYYFDEGGLSNMRKSVVSFKEAIARDSAFAHAYVGLADATGFVGEMDFRPAHDWQPQVERYLRKAIAIDETIPEAHSLLALYYADYAYDLVSAEEQHRRAIQLNPNSVDARMWYGLHLLILGNLDQSIAEFRRAVELDPLLPLARGQLARALLFSGRDSLALIHIRAGMETHPNWGMYVHLWAMSLVLRGKKDSAIALLNEAPKTPWNGWLYGVAGRTDTTRRILDSLLAESKERPVDPFAIAVLQMGLGNKEAVFAALDQAYAERSPSLRLYLGPYPTFNPIRNDARFIAMRRRVGFSR